MSWLPIYKFARNNKTILGDIPSFLAKRKNDFDDFWMSKDMPWNRKIGYTWLVKFFFNQENSKSPEVVKYFLEK